MKRKSLIFLAAVATLFLSGCPSLWNTSTTAEKPSTPDEIYKQAEESFQNKDYARAQELYESIRTSNPSDFKKIPEVNLQIAEALYNRGLYETATSRYYQFLDLYPNHKDVPKAKFQIAMCHFKQIKREGLDIRAVRQAREAFKQLMDDADAGEWRTKAEEKFNECQSKLAKSDLDSAYTYKGMGRYAAARSTAQRVVDEFPKTPEAKAAKDFLESIKNK